MPLLSFPTPIAVADNWSIDLLTKSGMPLMMVVLFMSYLIGNLHSSLTFGLRAYDAQVIREHRKVEH